MAQQGLKDGTRRKCDKCHSIKFVLYFKDDETMCKRCFGLRQAVTKADGFAERAETFRQVKANRESKTQEELADDHNNEQDMVQAFLNKQKESNEESNDESNGNRYV